MFGLGDIEALESRSVLASSTVKAVSDAAAKYSWDDVTQYLQLITLENLHEHVPLLNRQALDHIL